MHCPKGSVWRRWDLHVHTPASYQQEFGPAWEPATWQQYVDALIEASVTHSVKAIALADYFTIQGYANLVESGLYDPATSILRGTERSAALLIIPGIELRLDRFTYDGHAINIHVLFDPAALTHHRIQADFLDQLPIAPRPGGTSLRLVQSHVLAFGQARKTGRNPDLGEDLGGLPEADLWDLRRRAYSDITISLQDLREYLARLDGATHGGRCYLIGLAGTGHGGLHELPWEGRAATIRQELLEVADFVFSANTNDRRFCLGEHPGTPVAEFLERFGRLKPCVWGSDAHTLDNLLHPSNGTTRQYCWIKADLCFEGLKQIVFEPADRVRVQEQSPDAKSWPEVIDKVRFLDKSAAALAAEDWIEVNPDLAAIIGGKSSGKSLLMYFIAKTADREQTSERLSSAENSGYGPLESQLSFEIQWRNGDRQLFDQPSKPPSRITYIPQSYINRLAEPKSQDQLEDVILRLLKEDGEISRREEVLREDILEARRSLAAELNRCLEHVDEIRVVTEKLADFGGEGAAVAEVERLSAEIKELQDKSGFGDEEATVYEGLIAQREQQESLRSRLQVRTAVLEEFAEKMGGLLSKFSRLVDEQTDVLGSRLISDSEGAQRLQSLAETLKEGIEGTVATARGQVSHEVGVTRERLVAAEQSLARLQDDLEPYTVKVANQAHLAELEESRRKHQRILTEVRTLVKRLGVRQEQLQESRGRVLGHYRRLHALRDAFVQQVLRQDVSEVTEDILLVSEVKFRSATFATKVREVLDGRQRLQGRFRGFDESENGYTYHGLDEHVAVVEDLLSTVTSSDFASTLKLKKSYSAGELATRLLEDHFHVHLTLKHEGDELPQMSPGKRGMVLLRLLLEKSDASHPILIDQPEDNLDNRTVFSQLRNAVKRGKARRQIILVTHNANLVVSTDADQVIVAHQRGESELADGGFRFEYHSGSLEHSHTTPEAFSPLTQKGTKEHVCEVLEGGEEAFRNRQQRYEFGAR